MSTEFALMPAYGNHEILTTEERKAREGFESLREDLQKQSRTIIHLLMPTKILSLDELLKAFPELRQSDLREEIVEELKRTAPELLGKKKRMAEGDRMTEAVVYQASFGSNMRIIGALETLKSEFLELIEVVFTVKAWVGLNVPKAEDGNNFGVSVQDDLLGELARVEVTGVTILDSVSRFHISRAKLVTKIIKHPGVDDYIQALAEMDEKAFANIRLRMRDLRNSYILLYDLLQKNIEKVLKPRGQNSANMY